MSISHWIRIGTFALASLTVSFPAYGQFGQKGSRQGMQGMGGMGGMCQMGMGGGGGFAGGGGAMMSPMGSGMQMQNPFGQTSNFQNPFGQTSNFQNPFNQSGGFQNGFGGGFQNGYGMNGMDPNMLQQMMLMQQYMQNGMYNPQNMMQGYGGANPMMRMGYQGNSAIQGTGGAGGYRSSSLRRR
ncbi:MAG TPA: hypothetical protein VFE62_23980 [Gemmataceae bacterium]|nr:hypothetical protein [Gemmataceae bacterium]